MKRAALTVLLTALTVTAARADIIAPPPPPAESEIDQAALAAAAAPLPGTQWGLDVIDKGEAFTGDLAFGQGNRFTLTVREAGAANSDDAKSGFGVWGVIEATAGGEFVLVLDVLERDDGGYDSDEVISFRLKAEGEGKLTGTLMDDEHPATVTLTRR